MEEQVLHSSGLAHITPTAVYLNRETVQIANIGSVSIDTDYKWNPLNILIIASGIICALIFSNSPELILVGVVLFFAGIILQRFFPIKEVKLRIKYAGGVTSLMSNDPNLMTQIKRTIEYAFSMRPSLTSYT